MVSSSISYFFLPLLNLLNCSLFYSKIVHYLGPIGLRYGMSMG